MLGGRDHARSRSNQYLHGNIIGGVDQRHSFIATLYAKFLPPSVASRPIKGEAPTIDLVLGYHKENSSPLLKLFLSRVDDLIAHLSKKSLAAGDCTLAAFRERCVCSLPSSSVFQVP
jgi:hypothetical protein